MRKTNDEEIKQLIQGHLCVFDKKDLASSKAHIFLCTMVGKLWYKGHIWPTTCFTNKALLEHSLRVTRVELSRYNRDHLPCQVENTFWPFKCAVPCSTPYI